MEITKLSQKMQDIETKMMTMKSATPTTIIEIREPKRVEERDMTSNKSYFNNNSNLRQ